LSLRIKARIVDPAMDTLLKSMSSTKRARDDEGYYHFRGSGTVSNPRFTPDRSKSRGGSTSRDNDYDDDKPTRSRRRAGNSDDDASERRKKRRDRIKKRRERMKERRRKRRERESARDDDDMRDDERFPDDGPGNRGRKRLVLDEVEVQGRELPEIDEGIIDEMEDIEEPPEEPMDEELDDLGYVNE